MSIFTKDWKAYIFLMLGMVAMTCLLWSLAFKNINDEKRGYSEPIYISQEFDIVCTGGNNYHISGALANLSNRPIKVDKITLKLSAYGYKGEYDIENITVYNNYYISENVKYHVPNNTNIKVDRCSFTINGETRNIKYSPDGKDFSSDNVGGIIGGCVCLVIAILILCAMIYRYKMYKETGI